MNLYNLGKKFLRLSSRRKVAVTWILARLFAYFPSFFSQILDVTYWTVLNFILIYSEWRDTENKQLTKIWREICNEICPRAFFAPSKELFSQG